MTRTVLLFFGALSVAGCLHPDRVGRFATDGFHPTADHYRIRYRYGVGPRALLSPEWEIDNFAIDESGRARGRWGNSDDLSIHDARDRRGRRRHVGVRYDLRFRNDFGAEIFARTIPIDHDDGSALPEHSVHRGLHALSAGNGPDLLGRGPRRYRVWIVSEAPAIVDGRRGYSVTFDLSPKHLDVPTERATVVALRADPHLFPARRRRVSLPGLIVLGYVTLPDRHDLHRSEFETLVERVDVRPR
jgi:hypothetical protein